MKSVNWWESPCPKWDCFWHDKMQINAAWGLIWLAAQDFELKGENSWEEWNYWGDQASTQSNHASSKIWENCCNFRYSNQKGGRRQQKRDAIQIRNLKFFFRWNYVGNTSFLCHLQLLRLFSAEREGGGAIGRILCGIAFFYQYLTIISFPFFR